MVYTISAVASIDNSTEYRVLIDGMEQMAVIHETEHERYYSLNIKSDTAESIKFTLQVAQGSISMFISNKTAPSRKHYQYKLENVQQETTQELVVYHDHETTSYLIVIYAESNSIYSIRADVNSQHSSIKKKKFHKAWLYILGAVIFIIISILSVIGFANYRKNKKLKYELDVAELQLNMSGKKSMRQRREELQSTTSGPAKPFNENQKTKTTKKIKKNI